MTKRRNVLALVATCLAATVTVATSPVPGWAAPVPPGGPTATACYVDLAHMTFLDREATVGEIEEWSDAFADGVKDHVLIGELAGSDEWLAVTVGQIYLLALDRAPEPEGLDHWVEKLRAGALVNEIGAAIFGSAEFYELAGGTDAGFVDRLYELILDRGPDAPGLAYWLGQVDRRGRGGVASEFYASYESRAMRVNGLYHRLLDRRPDAGGFAYWTDRLRTVNDVRLAMLIASEAEFATLSRGECRFALEVTTNGLPDAVIGAAYVADLEATGGQEPYTWVATGLPEGLSVSGQQIVGTPVAEGIATVELQVTDAEGSVEHGVASVAVTGAVVDLDQSGLHTCAVMADGTGRCWGYNAFGQLGDGTTTSRSRPRVVTGLARATHIAAGGSFSCAVVGGPVSCWGNGTDGRMGNGTEASSTTPVPVTGITDAVAVEAGGSSACALRAGGTVHCWGTNSYGQLGDGTADAASTPVQVLGLTTAVEIAVGASTACARRADTTVVCWGRGSSGQLGHGLWADAKTPVVVAGLSGVRSVTVGSSHACAVDGDDGAHCWGSNEHGQLGDGTTTDRSTPHQALDQVAVIAAGASTTCAAGLDGAVRCWGDSDRGALGQGTDPDPAQAVTTPTLVPGPTEVEDILVGDRAAFALGPDDTLWTWGLNGAGQLGTGSNAAVLSPITITVE